MELYISMQKKSCQKIYENQLKTGYLIIHLADFKTNRDAAATHGNMRQKMKSQLGRTFEWHLDKAMSFANLCNTEVEFNFNDINFIIDQNSKPSCTHLQDCYVMGWKSIGPDYNYSEEIEKIIQQAYKDREKRNNLLSQQKSFASEMYDLLELTSQKLESEDPNSRQAQRIRQLLSRINSNT